MVAMAVEGKASKRQTAHQAIPVQRKLQIQTFAEMGLTKFGAEDKRKQENQTAQEPTCSETVHCLMH